MKINLFFFIGLVGIFLLLSGCSGEDPDCSKHNTDYVKYSYNSENKKCEPSKTIEEDVCGNGVKEDGETYCNCDDDVSKGDPIDGCDGELGDFLEKSCKLVGGKQECVLSENDKVVPQRKSVEFGNSDITFKGEFVLDSPFILESFDNNKMSFINMELFKTSTSYQFDEILVKEIIVQNSADIVFAKLDYEEYVMDKGDSLPPKEFDINPTKEYLSKESLEAIMVVHYTKRSIKSTGEIGKPEEEVVELKQSLGRWEIINPSFYEDDD